MTERELLIAGLDEICPGYPVDSVDKLLRFSEILLKKNKVMNLTAIVDPKEVIARHFLDCAALVPYIRKGMAIIDIGTGAGFPGIPLAILTDASYVLLDAQRKRIDFLGEVIEQCNIENCAAVHARAEEYAAKHREGFDMAVSRAVASLSMLTEFSLPMLKIGGIFFAMKAAGCEEEVSLARNGIEILGGGEPRILEYSVPIDDLKRTIVCISKILKTPEIYPRRFKKMQTSPL